MRFRFQSLAGLLLGWEFGFHLSLCKPCKVTCKVSVRDVCGQTLFIPEVRCLQPLRAAAACDQSNTSARTCFHFISFQFAQVPFPESSLFNLKKALVIYICRLFSQNDLRLRLPKGNSHLPPPWEACRDHNHHHHHLQGHHLLRQKKAFMT